MMRSSKFVSALWALWLLLPTNPVAAEAVFVVHWIDGPAEGSNDTTPVSPIGGNHGTTLGEQRRIAIEYAASLWGSVLRSAVEIIIEADWAELGCDDSAGAVLASAAPATAAVGLTAQWSDPNVLYPAALADRLQEADIDPGYPDIIANFNSSVDLPSCGLPVRWYYGLDGRGDGVDLVQATLHELAHGLGIAPLVDANTGGLLADEADPFTALIYDHVLGARLHEVSDGDRMAALAHSRQVVFDGPRAQVAAQQLLVRGNPSLSLAPAVAGFTEFVADTNFSPVPVSPGVTAPVIEGAPNDGCSKVNNARGNIILLRPRCYPDQVADYLESAGAVGLILGISEHWDSPPSPMDLDSVIPSNLPTLVISDQDADRLANALSQADVTATIAGNFEQEIGADVDGRPLLNATDPVTSSMLSHWDMSVRPNLLMEPFVRPMDDPHSLDLTLAVLQDIGWEDPARQDTCGNSELDEGEECDDGVFNSDTAIDACRRDCTAARCGDGIADSGEICDDGALNGGKDACRKDCTGEGDCPASAPRCVTEAAGFATTSNNNGCGCDVASKKDSPSALYATACALLLLVRARRWSRLR